MTEDQRAVEAVARGMAKDAGLAWDEMPEGCSFSIASHSTRWYWRQRAKAAIAAYKAHLEAEKRKDRLPWRISAGEPWDLERTTSSI